MKIIYLDSDFRCHIEDDGTMKAIETSVFDGKCDEFIEGYRFVPEGEVWVRSDGAEFYGEMIAPWKSYSKLDNAQREYEKAQLADYKAAFIKMGGVEV